MPQEEGASKRTSEGHPAQLPTTSAHPGEEHRQVNQKIGLLTYFSLCLLGIFFAGPFLQVEADTCAREWLPNQGNYYAYFDNKLTWQEAETECKSYGRGAHLASILARAEALLVAEHISTYQELSDVWIGLHDVRWTRNGTDGSPYKSWMSYQPDNDGKNEHCVELRQSTGFQLWNDNQCSKLNAHICKQEL